MVINTMGISNLVFKMVKANISGLREDDFMDYGRMGSVTKWVLCITRMVMNTLVAERMT